MEQDETVNADLIESHPLIVTYPHWLHPRLGMQTVTTQKAISAAYEARDIELLEAYDRLLGDRNHGAWIKYVVKAVRKKPELGTVAGITKDQCIAYTEMRKAVNVAVYGGSKKQFPATTERDRSHEYALFDYAISSWQDVPLVVGLIRDRNLTDLSSIFELVEEVKASHSALAEGVL